MKSPRSLFCTAVLGIVLAAVPPASQAAALDGDALRIALGAGLLMGQQDDDRRRHRRDDNNNNNSGNNDRRGDDRRDDRNDRRDDRGPPPQDRGGYDRGGGGGEQRDNRINRAMAIAQTRGRVMNAWPQGGSIFMVRVDTPRGRVDIIIDVDSGRIIEER